MTEELFAPSSVDSLDEEQPAEPLSDYDNPDKQNMTHVLAHRWRLAKEAFEQAEDDAAREAAKAAAKALAVETEAKLDSYAGAIRKLEGVAATLKAEADRLGVRAKSRKGEADRAKERASMLMQAMERASVKTPANTFSLQGGRVSLKIDPLVKLPLAYTISSRKANNAKIKKAIESGTPVEGCRLETGKPYVTIR